MTEKKDNGSAPRLDGRGGFFANLDYLELLSNAMSWTPKFKAQLVCRHWYEADATGAEKMTKDQLLTIESTFNKADAAKYYSYVRAFKLYMGMGFYANMYYWQIVAMSYTLLRLHEILRTSQRTEKWLREIWAAAKGTAAEKAVRQTILRTKLTNAKVMFTKDGDVRVDRAEANGLVAEYKEHFSLAVLQGRAFIAAIEKYAKRHGGLDLLTQALSQARAAFKSDWAADVIKAPSLSQECLAKKAAKGKTITPEQWERAVFPDERGIIPSEDDISVFTDLIRVEALSLSLMEKYGKK